MSLFVLLLHLFISVIPITKTAVENQQFSDSCPPSIVHSTNQALLPLLNELVKTSVFRYFKVSLQKECPFWKENLLCTLNDCSVLEAREEEVPKEFKEEIARLSAVDYSVPVQPFFPGSGTAGHGLIATPKKCSTKEEDFCLIRKDIEDEDGIFINLLNNPERYTGYAGESAARVWSAIYKENCFPSTTYFEEEEAANDSSWSLSNINGMSGGLLDIFSISSTSEICQEKKVFYRLVSGLHSSISLHICGEYFDRKTGVWARNLTCFLDRFAEYPDRIENMYFLWSVLVRSISKLTPYLSNYPFCKGSEDELFVRKHVDQVIQAINTCPDYFDEKSLFQNHDAKSLKAEFKQRFRNISLIMDCVGCEKCRLWGKVQIFGLGTALKVLFSYKTNATNYRLTKPELVSLINLFNRVAESVNLVSIFQSEKEEQEKLMKQEQVSATFERGNTFYLGVLIFGLAMITIMYFGYSNNRPRRGPAKGYLKEKKKK